MPLIQRISGIQSVSSVPMVGCRNSRLNRSQSGLRVYQVFRWWGVGTHTPITRYSLKSVSSVPMVGCRNRVKRIPHATDECIKCSDGGVSELQSGRQASGQRVYQVFRWWGVGTHCRACQIFCKSVSSVPMVGCRNAEHVPAERTLECIKCSDGGVSERIITSKHWRDRVYQVFRWWGVGTVMKGYESVIKSVSSVPMVGCRNK